MKYTCPILPTGAAFFNRIDFGGDGNRGANPEAITASERYFPISELLDGKSEHLNSNKAGAAGTVLQILDGNKEFLALITLTSRIDTPTQPTLIQSKIVPAFKKVDLKLDAQVLETIKIEEIAAAELAAEQVVLDKEAASKEILIDNVEIV